MLYRDVVRYSINEGSILAGLVVSFLFTHWTLMDAGLIDSMGEYKNERTNCMLLDNDIESFWKVYENGVLQREV